MKYLKIFDKLTPRINITYKCNMFSYCSYCYSKEELNKYKTDMKIEDFTKIITLFKQAYGIEDIVFLGGESTMHSDIEQMGEILKRETIGSFIFTNGCFNQDKFNILKNTNSFHTIIFHYEESFLNNGVLKKIFIRNLSGLSKNKNIILRFNTGKINFDYKELINLAKQFHASIAYSLTSPTLNRDIKYVPMNEMRKYIPGLIQFIEEAYNNKVEVFTKRPLPLCIFNQNEIELLKSNGGLRAICCIGSICVNPDLSLIASPTLTKLYCEPVNNLTDLINKVEELSEKVENLKWKSPTTPSCNECEYWKKRQCQGACTVYKMCREKQIIEPVIPS